MEDEEFTQHKQRKGTGAPYDEDWLPNEAFASLEAMVNPSETSEELATRIYRESAPVAALSVCQLAKSAVNENTRLRAACYVTDRVLGSPSSPNGDTKGNVFDDLLRDIVRNDASSSSDSSAAS